MIVLNLRRKASLALGLAAAMFAVGLGLGVLCAESSSDAAAARGIKKIEHVIVIVQQNRSFDNYFGSFPGAEGIPMKNGIPTVCLPNPAGGPCVRPARDSSNYSVGGLHGYSAAVADINGGKMDGFLGQLNNPAKCRRNPGASECVPGARASDAIGYHDYHEIPNYWAYARNFVLQDRMFASSLSWGGPTGNLFMVSGWSARCRDRNNPMSCESAVETNPENPGIAAGGAGGETGAVGAPRYPWTDITYLLHKAGVSWAQYAFTGTEADCSRYAAEFLPSCAKGGAGPKTPDRWSTLAYFETVRDNGQLENIQSIGRFYEASVEGNLPAVSWVVPNFDLSERAPGVISDGESYVTGLVNAVMTGPDWESSAIFVTWDDWGGYYDHLAPPEVDENGYGIRVPGLVISPYAKRGYVDHQTLSSDAYLKFIEDVFLRGRRLDPKTDGRPDSRPTVRERVKILGDLRRSFDFSQEPRDPLLLPMKPKRLQYFARWKGKSVRLISTPYVNVARVRGAKRIGRVRSFQTGDPAYRCLRGAQLAAWSLPKEFPGRILVSHRNSPGCRAGSWIIPR